MPQISPINWFILFIFFNIIFYARFTKLYYLSELGVSRRESGKRSLKAFNQTI